jgi:HK97 family phage portal protein
MGLFSMLFQKRGAHGPLDDFWYSPFMGATANSGAEVNEVTALNYSAVYNAISLIAGTVGSLPLHLMRRKPKSKEYAIANPLYKVLHSKPNEYMTAMSFRECMTAHVLSWGNCFAEKITDFSGNVIELWPIPPNYVEIKIEDGVLTYVVTIENKRWVWDRRKMFHVPGLGYNGINGYSVIQKARETIGLGLASEEFGARWFGSGTHPGVILSHPNKIGKEAHDSLKNDLISKYSGLGKSHRLLLLEEGMKIENIGFSPEDSQFLETRQFQVPEVARWFNLPPHKLKDLTKSSFNNIEQEQISFVTDSILPWLIRFESAYNTQLIPPESRGLYTKHIVEGLLRGDAESRGNFYHQRFLGGSIKPNEIRSLEDQDPDPNPMADELWVPMNMVPMSMAKAYIEKAYEDKKQNQTNSE